MGRVYLMSNSVYPDIPNFNTVVGDTPTNEQRLAVANYGWNAGNVLTYYLGPSNINSSNVRMTYSISGPTNIAIAFYYVGGSNPLTIRYLRASYPNTRYILTCTQNDGQYFAAYGVHGPVIPVAPYYSDLNSTLGGGQASNVTVELYSTKDEALAAITPYLWDGELDTNYPITYRSTNASYSGPDEAAVGDTVTVNYTFPDGYGIVNSSDIYVTNNGVLIPSVYSNGTLTFTMPDPS